MDAHSKQGLTGANDLDSLYNSTSAVAQIGEKLAELATSQTADGAAFAAELLRVDNLMIEGTPYEGKDEGAIVESVLSEMSKPIVLGPTIDNCGLASFEFDSQGELNQVIGLGEQTPVPHLHNIASVYVELVELGHLGLAAHMIERYGDIDIVSFDTWVRVAQLTRST